MSRIACLTHETHYTVFWLCRLGQRAMLELDSRSHLNPAGCKHAKPISHWRSGKPQFCSYHACNGSRLYDGLLFNVDPDAHKPYAASFLDAGVMVN